MPGIAKPLGSKEAVGRMRRGYNVAQSTAWHTQVAYQWTSDTDTEKIKFLGAAPFMKQREGDRQTTDPDLHELSIENLTYDVATTFKRDDIRRDRTGQIPRFIRDMGAKAALLPEERLTLGILEGSAAAYDGSALYADRSSSRFGGQIDNRVTNSPTAVPANPTSAEAETGIMAAITRMLEAVDENGTPINQDQTDFLVMAPPKMLRGVAGALNNEYTASGVSNTLANLGGFQVRMLINPWLTAANNYIYVFGLSGDLRALVWQEELAVTFEALAAGSDFEVENDAHAFFAKRMGAVAPGEPAVTVRCEFTA